MRHPDGPIEQLLLRKKTSKTATPSLEQLRNDRNEKCVLQVYPAMSTTCTLSKRRPKQPCQSSGPFPAPVASQVTRDSQQNYPKSIQLFLHVSISIFIYQYIRKTEVLWWQTLRRSWCPHHWPPSEAGGPGLHQAVKPLWHGLGKHRMPGLHPLKSSTLVIPNPSPPDLRKMIGFWVLNATHTVPPTSSSDKLERGGKVPFWGIFIGSMNLT